MSEGLTLVVPGTLTVGVDASAPGALHSDPAEAGFQGFEVDLMEAVAARLGLTYRYRGGLWAGLIDELRSGGLDAIVTAATVTEERRRTVDFSEPYFDYRLAIVARKGSGIRSPGDLAGRRLGARVATTAHEFVRRALDAGEVRAFHTNVEAYEAVRAGTLDAVVEDEPIAQWFVERDPLLELSSTIPGTDAQYAVMFRKGNDALRHAVNRALGELRAKGTYGQLYGKWFGAGRKPSLTSPAPPDPEA